MLILTALIGSCIPVTTPRITARDLALADPRFRALPSTEIIGFAPDPGVRRTFAVAELERLASKQNLSPANLNEVCFEVPLQPLTRADIEHALSAQAELQVLEAPEMNVPVGTLVFPPTGLQPPVPDGSQLWRGYVQYAETRRANVWVRVKITQTAVIKRGETIPVEVQSGAAQLHFEAIAERPARDGELIELRNPSTGKLFRARLVGKRAVIKL